MMVTQRSPTMATLTLLEVGTPYMPRFSDQYGILPSAKGV
jgi:hypothetical protein